jgi:hypothetical protein
MPKHVGVMKDCTVVYNVGALIGSINEQFN